MNEAMKVDYEARHRSVLVGERKLAAGVMSRCYAYAFTMLFHSLCVAVVYHIIALPHTNYKSFADASFAVISYKFHLSWKCVKLCACKG